MLDLPFVFCNSAHCYMEAILSIFDVYELKVSLITNRFVFCMYYKCLPTVICLSAVFLSCTNVSFSDCKSKCGVFLKHRKPGKYRRAQS